MDFEAPNRRSPISTSCHMWLRLDYLGLLNVWTSDRRHGIAWWALAREWPSFKRGIYDRITKAEFAEMRTHGPKIRDELATLLAGLRQVEVAATK